MVDGDPLAEEVDPWVARLEADAARVEHVDQEAGQREGILPRRPRRRAPPPGGGEPPAPDPAHPGVAEPDGDHLPPLPPPPEAAEPRRGAKRRPGFRNPEWLFPGGKIVYDVERESLDAHCLNPNHKDKSNPCRVNRTRLPDARGRPTAQGRPLGLLIRWLQICDLRENRTLHTGMCKPKEATELDLALLEFENRVAARDLYFARPEYTDLFGLERPPRTGEGPEPLGKC